MQICLSIFLAFRCANREFVRMISVMKLLLLVWVPCDPCGHLASTSVFASDGGCFIVFLLIYL